MVLSSNAIAKTSSNCPPPPENPFPFLLELTEGYLRVTPDLEVAAALKADFTGYSWRINGYNKLGEFRALQIRTMEPEPIVTGPTAGDCSGCPTGFFGGPGSVIVSPSNTKSFEPEAFTNGDTYSIQVWVQWTIPKDCTLHAYYDISGTWPESTITLAPPPKL